MTLWTKDARFPDPITLGTIDENSLALRMEAHTNCEKVCAPVPKTNSAELQPRSEEWQDNQV